ncbi:MAG TPA: hypothetical protein ENI34_08680 [candidate division WOR-3 bacterium]|uniref:Lipoprotein n=1 Tax=candidate division WOR-3 bacterium TaxID=2052148 RepID=A0A9C9K0M0_UNCW3|nr:hypothetical protein [candidate division WOR-3 bacterium]
MANIKRIAIIIFFIICGCAKKSSLERIVEGDFSLVAKGTYRGTTKFLRDGGVYIELVSRFRGEIEKKEEILSLIARKYFFVPQKMEFNFKFAALDEEKRCLILRYFARVVNHPIYAGYQIQFVYDIETKRLIKIYTSEVPLE